MSEGSRNPIDNPDFDDTDFDPTRELAEAMVKGNALADLLLKPRNASNEKLLDKLFGPTENESGF